MQGLCRLEIIGVGLCRSGQVAVNRREIVGNARCRHLTPVQQVHTTVGNLRQMCPLQRHVNGHPAVFITAMNHRTVAEECRGPVIGAGRRDVGEIAGMCRSPVAYWTDRESGIAFKGDDVKQIYTPRAKVVVTAL